jgi:hypothetical protein
MRGYGGDLLEVEAGSEVPGLEEIRTQDADPENVSSRGPAELRSTNGVP